MGNEEKRSYQFGEFRVDPLERLLIRGDAVVPIPPKAFDLLLVFVRNPGLAFDKQELMQAIWPDTFVEEGNLAQNISVLRKALGETGEAPQYIQTIPRRGYRFLPRVEQRSQAQETLVEETHSCVVVEEEEIAVRDRTTIRTVLLCASTAFVLAAWLLVDRLVKTRPKEVTYEQITNLTESAVAPALSPDGRMVAFIRGDEWFLSTDQIYVKWLPNGQPVQLTRDPRPKFAPTFSPDGFEIAYTVTEPSRGGWDTMMIPVLGGEPRLLLPNAAGLTWLGGPRFLFSEIKTGIHMAIVTAAESRAGSRDIYMPQHKRAMAHFSYASPDRKWVLIIEMDHTTAWGPCRLVRFDGSSQPRQVGPSGPCTSAAWSPDGKWMYFSVAVEGKRHLWRQRFPDGVAEQITFGLTEEEGIAVAPDGRSLITSVGTRQSAIWLHDSQGEHPISSEGYVSNPSFAADGSRLYYLVQRHSPSSPKELWIADLKAARSEPALPGFSMESYDVSPDGKEVVFTTRLGDRNPQVWLAPLHRRSPPRQVASSGEDDPHFGPSGELLVRMAEGGANYLFRLNRDGSGRAKVVPYPIANVFSVSPDRRWFAALAPVRPGEPGIALMAVPTQGGPPRQICSGYCVARWAPDGRFLYVTVQHDAGFQSGQVVAIPVPPGESLPRLPDTGISSIQEAMKLAEGRVIETNAARGNRGETDIAPGLDPSVFAYVKKTIHRNLFRIPLN
jgi:DNA-binding winged helix-turn-helix (wHTH) protein/Tol biopolymer transport system component